MANFFKSKPVIWLRRIIHWLRVALLFIIFLAVFILVYLHQIGLPAFARQSLVQKLRKSGWEIQFTTAHLAWGHILTLENAAGRRSGQPLAPSFSAQEAELDASPGDLLRSQIRSLHFVNGQLRFPLSETNRTALSLDDLQLHLVFLTNDAVQLSDTRATVRGIRIDLSGRVEHASAMRDWKFARPAPRTNFNFQAKVEEVSELLAKLDLQPAPRLEFTFGGDGRDTNSFNGALMVIAPSAQTPWGNLKTMKLMASCTNLLRPEFAVDATINEVVSPWGSGSNISLAAKMSRSVVSNFDGHIVIAADTVNAQWKSHAETNWIHALAVHWDGRATLAATNFFPLAADGTFESGAADSPWGSAAQVRLAVQGSTLPEKSAAPVEWGIWSKLAPYALNWQAEISKVTTPKLAVEKAALSGSWLAPNVTVTNLTAKLYHGTLSANAALNISSREVRLKSVSDFDPLGVTQMMTPAAQHFFSQFAWESPPKINAELGVILPAWTNRQPDWRGEVAPTVKIAGKFSVGNSSFRNVPATSADSQFGYTNREWNLPRLHAVNADGEVYLDYRGSEITHEYYFAVDSQMDPGVARPLFEPQQQKFFDEAHFMSPPKIHGEIWGQWREKDRTGFIAHLTATNFTVRGEKVDDLNASIDFTNQVMMVRDLRITLKGRQAIEPLAVVDFAHKKVILTNVLSHVDPSGPISVSGPHRPDYLLAFQFEPPPTVKINGSFAWNNPLATDLHFDIDGDHMHWTNLLADHISGQVDWVARNAVVTNVVASLYGGGRLSGSVEFQYEPKKGTDFRSEFTVTNISLPALARGLSGKTNRLEGLLDGRVVITTGHTTDKKSWTGYGYANLNDGLLWEIPVFGIFSPLLNGIKEGAGNSRARNASGNFIITNAAVYSEDLEIHSGAARLVYKGSVGFDKKLDATVEAEVLRDTPVIGRLVSMVLLPVEKLLVFKVSGTTAKPVSQPLYKPTKFMLELFRPFNTLKTMFPDEHAPDPTEQLTSPKYSK